MRERIDVLGGRLEIGVRADGRFAVTATLPLQVVG
jgi:signal transduction histidine kinase